MRMGNTAACYSIEIVKQSMITVTCKAGSTKILSLTDTQFFGRLCK